MGAVAMSDDRWPEGMPVQVLTHFKQTWASGFAIDGAEPALQGAQMYRVRRVSDNAVLPASFGAGELRPEPR
jgi:hypothetical protein